MRRSHAPIFWLLFGAGGMLSALLGAVLVFVTGLAVPLGWPLPADLLAYPRVLAFAQGFVGKLALLAVIALFAWHAAHRLLCTVHDFGIHKGLLAKGIAYGSALVVTLVSAQALLRL
jgi:fumarate reductase subunit D